jgi:cobalt-zinc-cadmium efflux system outer membrane protein
MESQREMKNVAKKMGSPGFTLGANYINVGERTDMNPPGNGTDAIMFPQVGIRLPLQRKKYTAMKREAQLNEEAILFTQQNLKNQLRVEAEMAVRNYNTALRNYSLASEQQILVEKGIDLMIASFSTGKKSLEDLVQLQRKKIEFENLKAKSVYEGNAQSAFLKYLLAY